jgi:Domain of unknown function (DUF6265)
MLSAGARAARLRRPLEPHRELSQIALRFQQVLSRAFSRGADEASAGPFGDHAPAPAQAQSGQTSEPQTETPRIADLSWLGGRWLGKWGPRTAEQDWMSPRAGLMVGTFRLLEDNDTLLVELFTLTQKGNRIELRFRHFTPALVPWEKSDATVLTLESIDAQQVVFENSMNGQPKRALFIRVDPDTYRSRSEIVSSGGTTKVVEITFHRQTGIGRVPPRKSAKQKAR